MNITKTSAGMVGDQEALVYELTADNGTSVKITNIGATIMSIKTPDRNGKLGEIVLGFDDPKMYISPEYLADSFYFGCTVGRYANRIKKGRFTLNNKTYELEINNGENHLHGGVNSFNTKFWQSDEFTGEDRVGVKMSYVSPHMENGYPGELTVTVVFTLTNNNELQLNYMAKTDRKTVLNLTNHSYFNLRGEGDIFDTKVIMNAGNYTPVDEGCIPLGTVESVKGTPLDFSLEHTIGERLHMYEIGYDNNLVIDGKPGELRQAVECHEETTGRTLTMLTTEPAFQFYTSHYLNGKYSRGPLKFAQYCGFALEAQHYPDSPNNKSFPSTELKPGETYTQTTIYRFGVK